MCGGCSQHALSVSACGVSCSGPGWHPGAAAPHRRAVGCSPEHGHRMPHHVQVESRNRPSTEWPAGILGSPSGAGGQGTCWAPGPATRHISSWGFTPCPGGRRCILAQVPGCQGERGWACSGCPCWWAGLLEPWHSAPVTKGGGDPFSWRLSQLFLILLGFPHGTSKGCQHSPWMLCSG